MHRKEVADADPVCEPYFLWRVKSGQHTPYQLFSPLHFSILVALSDILILYRWPLSGLDMHSGESPDSVCEPYWAGLKLLNPDRTHPTTGLNPPTFSIPYRWPLSGLDMHSG